MQPATPCNTTASQQCTQFWVLPALVLLALCTPLASAAREWAAQTWSEHLPRICTAVLLYHAARNWASSLARRIPTLASTQARVTGGVPLHSLATPEDTVNGARQPLLQWCNERTLCPTTYASSNIHPSSSLHSSSAYGTAADRTWDMVETQLRLCDFCLTWLA